ncbi:PhoU domain-containing protein [Bacillus licheniformis]|nr:PhoU domain-containing protein [Bacillus licheniformis]
MINGTQASQKHILRLNDGLCSGQAGVIFVDITSNLERIGDHAVNIAEAVLGEESIKNRESFPCFICGPFYQGVTYLLNCEKKEENSSSGDVNQV